MCSHGGIADLVDVSACRSSPNRLLLFELLSIGIEIAIERSVLARESTSGKHRVGRELVVPGQFVLGTKRHALEARLRVPIGV
jgi:hypothetical protein